MPELGHYRPVSSGLEDLFESPAASRIPGYISKHELANQLGVTTRTIDNWRPRYGIIFIQIGRDLYCRETTAQELADKQMAEAERSTPRCGRLRRAAR